MPLLPTQRSTTNPNQQQIIQELRVADHELHSGNQTGRVFVQLTAGSVAFLMDRPVVQARVVRRLHQAIELEDRHQASEVRSSAKVRM